MQPLVSTYHSFLSLLATAVLAFSLSAQHGESPSGSLPAGHPPIPAVQPPVVERPAAESPATQPSQPSAPTTSPTTSPTTGPAQGAEDKPEQAKKPAKKRPKKDGIPVEDLLVQSFCSRCHIRDDREHMTRISYVRKSPEGWARTIKRMGRLHGLQLTPSTAKMLVRSLSNSHGLARKEAERGLYQSERRVHWSEEHHDEDFKRACAQCHPLGRALLQHRDKDEWQLLRATHVAMFPLSSRQMGGGPPRDSSSRRFNFPTSTTSSSTRGSRSGGSSSRGSSSSSSSSSRGRSSSGGVGDRVLDRLSKDQPLFTPAWEAWTQNRREVPLAGTWTVHGHETGRGDVIGTLQVTRTEADEYDLTWQLQWTDGSSATRTGKGVLYAGYSWRGRSKDADGTTWREVLLLDDQWQTFRGRLFTGAYDEIGVDVTLERDRGTARVVALGHAAITVPASNHALDVYGESFPETLVAGDFFVGKGLTVVDVERKSARHVVLRVNVASGTALGTRTIAYGPHPGSAKVTLYDTVDYVRVRPLQGLSRVGGAKHPRQLERFEAFAMHRGKDKLPFTDDDVDLFQVRPTWSLQEFRVRDHDDDLQYVGTIDATTGVFTPNLDGPNPKRKWQANNVGDVFVTCEVTLDVPVRPKEEKKADDGEEEGEADSDKADETKGEAHGDDGEDDANEDDKPIAILREQKTFRARSHLLVTIPIYVRWLVLDWEDR